MRSFSCLLLILVFTSPLFAEGGSLPNIGPDGVVVSDDPTCSFSEGSVNKRRGDGEVDCSPPPYEPTPCELALNSIWDSAQVEINALLEEPICSDFFKGSEPGVSAPDTGAPNLELTSGDASYVVVQKKALKRLRRKARKGRTCR